MYDFDNDQLGVFEEDITELLEEDQGFEQEDQVSSALDVLFDEEFTRLELKLELDRADGVAYADELFGTFCAVCDDEFDVDGTHYFELLLAERDLPAVYELFEDDDDII